MTAPAIRLDDVSVAYGRHLAVRRVSGVFAPGSLTAIAGPNGAGKSTLLRALMGEVPLASGAIDSAGLPSRAMAYLPQAAAIDRSFPISVADAVLGGAWRRLGALRGASADIAAKARQALASVGLEGFGSRAVGALSAGQFQRVLFARLLLQDAAVVLLDEPFTAVDARTTEDLLVLIEGWRREGRTVIAVLHDLDQVRAHFPQTLLLAREAIAWGPTGEVLSPLNLVRTRAAAERWDEARDRAPVLAGAAR